MNNIFCLVGMPGAGKTTAAGFFKEHTVIRFGDATDEELERRNWKINETNEKKIRVLLREERGMDAYAQLNEPKIETALLEGNVVVDDLMSYEELLHLKKKFSHLVVVCVYASPKTRQKRLSVRKIRPLTKEETQSRDHNELTKLHSGGPIALADKTIINEGTLLELKEEVKKIIQAY